MHGLSAGTFQQVVNARDDKQLVAVFLQMDKALVGVYHLFQVNVLFYDMRERVFGIILFIDSFNLLQTYLGFHHEGGEYATGEVTAVGDEINFGVETVLQLFQ